MKNKLSKFWHYWTDRKPPEKRITTELVDAGGDGHSFKSYPGNLVEVEKVEYTNYDSRLEKLIECVVLTTILAGLGFLVHTGIKNNQSLKENTSLTTQVYSKACGDDYILNEKETRQLIRDLKIPYSEEKSLSYAKKSKWKYYFPNGSYREFEHITTHTLELEL